ncbi:MAG TPA: hypothetical protein VM290_00230 [Gaiellaceae bacterium]|nr:hypothetical protein [Gaiellaceae bacterium]
MADLRAGAGLADAVVERLAAEARADPDTVGLVLTGSRAAGTADAASDFDVVWVLADDAFDARVASDGQQRKEGGVDRIFQTARRLEELAGQEHWARPTFIGARVVFDRGGGLAALLERVVTYPPEEAPRVAFDAYDAYLNGFVRSVRAWQKGEELGARLHASESVAWLVKALFALEGRVAPYHDRLSVDALAPLRGQGWQPDELRAGFLEVARDAAPARQQELERRVEAVMEARGVRAHADWGEQLERLKAARF